MIFTGFSCKNILQDLLLGSVWEYSIEWFSANDEIDKKSKNIAVLMAKSKGEYRSNSFDIEIWTSNDDKNYEHDASEALAVYVKVNSLITNISVLLDIEIENVFTSEKIFILKTPLSDDGIGGNSLGFFQCFHIVPLSFQNLTYRKMMVFFQLI